MASVDELVDSISGMTVLELSQLVKALEDKLGVKASAGGGGMMMAMPTGAAPAAAGGGAEAATPVEEQTEFDVMLTEIGANKINVIKVVRELTSLGLKEAKDLVEAAPKAVKTAVPKAEADAAVAKLKDAGATASVK